VAWDVSAHPARWTGQQLAGSAEWVHRFTPDEIDELRGIARRCVAEGVAIEALPPALPLLGPVLAAWRAALVAGRGFVLARGHTILHARTAYEDFDEPARRRHLLRLWLRAPA
jgi:hypothetical protein